MTSPARDPRPAAVPPQGDARARLHVDLAALGENYRRYCAATSARIGAVVKADAYGMGLKPVADTLYRAG
ncbi:MAG: alanine racemase, partial [Hydrogenophaga sp.]|uniref:alanine racemase n=1 Tax=Hydrogenophaga sp. TaxID=1904254 RepID=UPI0016B5F00A